ncbi:MAG: efflux RND transporter periplasmic adaptor subunit, partial [Oscillospiraceae bacterium]|nr:efflux RND transporter periplasmic adaptor subunit [Oscillospiraceae bacterium]
MNRSSAEKKKKKGRGLIVAIIALLVAGGGGTAVYFAKGIDKSTDRSSEYREYMVQKGNITIGTNESGTVSIERKYVSYPCAAEVEEVYVKTGTTVKTGDPLVKLSVSDIDEVKENYEDKIRSASLALDDAKLSYKTRSEQAKLTLESTVSKGSTAAAEYQSYVEKAAASKENSQKDLVSLRKELENCRVLLSSYDSDHSKLIAAEEKRDAAKNRYKEMEKQYKEYQKTDTANSDAVEAAKKEYNDYLDSVTDANDEIKKLKDKYEAAKTAYEKAQEEYDNAVEAYDTAVETAAASSLSSSSSQNEQGSGGSNNNQSNITSAKKKVDSTKKALNTASDEYNSAKLAYNVHYQKLEDKISDNIEKYENRISDLEKILSDHEKTTKQYKSEMDDQNDIVSEMEEEYNVIKSEFTEKYGSDDKDSLEDRIEKLTDEIKTSELNIRTSDVNSTADNLNARQQADQAKNDAANAQEVYDQTIASLENEIANKQKDYDKAVSDYEQFCESVTDGGIICAPCDGAVSAVNVQAGDTIAADMNFVTLTDRRYIYLTSAVSEEDITSLYTGQECSVSLSAYEGRTFAAHIDTISTEPARASGSVSYTVTVKLDDESGLNVLDGMTGEVDFLEKQVSDVLYVNVNAVAFRDGVSYVKVYDENRNVTEKPVVTGFSDGRNVEIR